MIGGNEENVVVLLSGLEDLTDSLVGGSDTLDSSLVHTSVADHVRWSKVVHNEVELVLTDTLGHLLTNTSGAHLRVEVISGHLGRWDHVADFTGELLLDTAVEEEGNVSILLSLSDVALLKVLLAEPLSQNIAHLLRRESNGESVVGLVLGHGGKGDVLGVREVGARRTVVVAEQLSDFTDTVRTVVEEKDSVII